MDVDFSSDEELKKWLNGKPAPWTLIVAFRAALRAIPVAIDPVEFRSLGAKPLVVEAMFRALVVSSSAIDLLRRPINEFLDRKGSLAPFVEAAIAIEEASYAENDQVSSGAGTPAIGAIGLAADLAYAVSYGLRGDLRASEFAGSVSVGSAYPYLWYEGDPDGYQAVHRAILQEVAKDCTALERGQSIHTLAAAPLWFEVSDRFFRTWDRACAWLDTSGDGFAIWREWYFGRLEGLPHAFDRFDAAADEVFYRWVIEQDDVWWKRDPATVNADIAAKVEELRRPAPPSDEELAQNPAVINFALDSEGRTLLAPEPLPNGLQDDPDARDTHGEIVRLISDARLSCDPGLTQATDMLNPVDLLAEAIGQSVADLRPRLFVLRGKELIRQFEERQRPDSMASPLSVGQTNCFAPLIAAVMQLADEDPKLRKLWQGPDGGAPALSKVQITILVDALAAVGQTTPEAQQLLGTAAGQVRSDASPDDPARRTTSEMIRNVFRSIGKRVKWVDDKSQAAIGFFDRMQDLWERVRSVVPDDDLIARILDFFKGGGG